MKTAFFVTGPESSATRLMTGLLVAAGCYGDDGHEQRLDRIIPDNEPLIVWRRSVPHGGDWDVCGAVMALHRSGYETTAIVMSRDWHSMAASQEAATHAENEAKALENIKWAYLNIFSAVAYADRFEIVNYEALILRPLETIRCLFRRLGLAMPEKIPVIYDGNARYYQETPARVSLSNPVSQLCTQSQFEEETLQKWTRAIRKRFSYRRKLWELAYIAQALDLAGLMEDGRRGLGFGVGREPLPALFASRGVEVLATDQPDGRDWAPSGQHSSGLADLPYEGICDPEIFERLVSHEAVDMNNIPDHLKKGEFDFVWSTGSLDHLGTIEAGLRFIHNSLDCLKPGGLAVHVTEFNTDSNEETLSQGDVVLFRERDIRQLADELTAAGHAIELDLTRGDGPIDKAVDPPPYNKERHIRLLVGGHVTTSIGLIIKK